MPDPRTRDLNQPGPAPAGERPTQRLDPADPDSRTCLRCQHALILAEAATDFRRDRVIVRLQSHPGLLAPRYVWSACYALVCPACGYTELYTVHPHKLAGGSP